MENTTENQNPKPRDSKLKNLLKSRNFKIFLFVLVLGLSLFGFTLNKEDNSQIQPEQVNPTPTLPYIERQQKKLQAINELPYETETYLIEYFPQDDTFWIKIKKNPFSENQKAALRWFTERDIDPENIQIQWTSVRGVAP